MAKPIKSSKHASREAQALDAVWSKESHLTLRTLIYVASLLEQLVKQRKGLKGRTIKLKAIRSK